MMSLTIDDVTAGTHDAGDQTGKTADLNGAASGADRWLYAMWGLRPGESSPTTSRQTAYSYPAEVAEWLHRLWGVPLATPTFAPEARPGSAGI